MGALEIFLVVFGILLITISYIFSEHLLSTDQGENEDASVTKVTKEIVKKEVEAEVANVIDDMLEQAEVKLDKLTNAKIMALGDYSDDVNAKINKNHDEVMFLYDMLSDKEKTIKNTVRDVEALKVSIGAAKKRQTGNDTISNAKQNEDALNEEIPKPVVKKNTRANAAKKKKDENIVELPKMDISDDEMVKKLHAAKVEVVGGTKTNNNEAILKLYNEGKTNIEIAKKLGLGMGEVKLVIDLFNCRKQ